jgi:hypothetical protein
MRVSNQVIVARVVEMQSYASPLATGLRFNAHSHDTHQQQKRGHFK